MITGDLKTSLRKALLKKRDGIDPNNKKAKETFIRKRLFASSDFRKAKSILLYASFKSEVDTFQCITYALEHGKKVMLPKVDSNRKILRLFQIHDISGLKPGYMCIPEPESRNIREKKIHDIDLVIVPGTGFDPAGNRLGYGAGYYDRLLSGPRREITIIALAFEEQIVPDIPSKAHDVKMDKIITEKRIINCRTNRRNIN